MEARVLAAIVWSAEAEAQETEARPFIGIQLAQGARGVRVDMVFPQSAGADAGLRAGDEVLAIDGAPTPAPPDLQAIVRAHAVGDSVTLHLLRDGAELDVTLALRPKPDEVALLKQRLEGKPAPAFALPDAKGPYPADTAALAGNVLVVELFATWCGPCHRSMPTLAGWQTTYGDRGLRVISVSDEDWATVKPFVDQNPVPYTIASDPQGTLAREAVQSGVVPTLYVVDRQGVVRFVDVGGGSTLAAVEATFVPLLAK